MKLAVTLVVSMLLCSLFPIPASAATVAGEGGVAMLIVRRPGMSEAQANDIAQHVATSMTAVGINIVIDSENSAKKLKGNGYELAETAAGVGKPKILAYFGTLLGVTTIVTMEVGALNKTVAIHLEVVNVADGKRLLRNDTITSKEELKSGSIPKLDEFAKELKSSLTKQSQPPAVAVVETPNKPAVVETPVKTEVATVPNPVAVSTVPEPPKQEQKVLPPAPVVQPPQPKAKISSPAEPPEPSHVLRWAGVAGIAAGVLTAGGGVVFGVTATSEHDSAVRVNGVKPDEFDTHQRNMINNARNADICYGVGAAVAAIGVTLFIIDIVGKSEPSKSVTMTVTGNGVGLAGTW